MKAFLVPFLLASAVTFCFATFSFGNHTLADEVEALRHIANTLGITAWDFNVDPCSGQSGWIREGTTKDNNVSVGCNCSFSSGTVCRVVSIVLKRQNLAGTLPKDLVKLPYLQEIDLTRNYIGGSIPLEWGSMQLTNISLSGNRLTGSIPKELANIKTLKSLMVEFNQLSGPLSPQLGDMRSIERFLISSNNFTGEIPDTLARLTTLKDFWICDNQFSGKIPNYIYKWTKLERLMIQASGLSGPIPSGIAQLDQLSDLRISDINGLEETFPSLSNLTKLQTLILRSCNITGQIPDYLGNMETLTTLDLSFNKLSGEIPGTFNNLPKANYIYLSGNLLTGKVQDWMLNKKGNIDLSYNNFSTGETGSPDCQHRTVNLFASSMESNYSGTVSCLGKVVCPQTRYKLHINCGGGTVDINESIAFEDDSAQGGPSTFFTSQQNWGFSSTGHFLDDTTNSDSYIQQNSSGLLMTNPELYSNARISPLSLTYYAFCLGNGNYTVKLHFAEIKFTDDKTYSSLGRRTFDVYIQGKLVWKDFNIAKEAGGVGKVKIINSTAVVTNTTLEIRLYWAGKGTTAIPDRGVYGPLISAISVNPDFTPPPETGAGISLGAKVGISVGAFIVTLCLAILLRKSCLRQQNMAQELRGLDLQTGKFSLRQIKAATNNFDAVNKIGEGGFGSVYKGFLSDGTIIAVKQLSSKSKQGNREFLNEIGIISALQHPNLVKLYGCCIEGDQLLLIYEYMENKDLARALFGPSQLELKLDWPTRHKICVGIAKGLTFLHEESRLKIVHRDIKATNILLDKDLNPKISDFGLAKLDEEDNTHISTRIAGTYGYMTPEYAMRGYLTDKADVYSFGIVVLEIVSGRSNTSYRPKEERFHLLDWALLLKQKGSLLELVDPRLGSDYNEEEVMIMINIALLCTNVSAAVRPAMSSVVSMLEGGAVAPELVSDSAFLNEEMKVQGKWDHLQIDKDQNVSESQTQSLRIDGQWTSSSISAADLYPVNLSSDYSEKRA